MKVYELMALLSMERPEEEVMVEVDSIQTRRIKYVHWREHRLLPTHVVITLKTKDEP